MATNNQELSSDDLAQVLRELFTVQGNWYNIGLCLGLGPAILGNIQSANQTNEVCLRNMLIQRINQGGLTWENIVEALEDVTVGRRQVAREIRARHCIPVATQRVSTTPRVAPGHPTTTIPQQVVFNSNAPVVTTARVAPGHPAPIPQQVVFNSNAFVIPQPPISRTNPVNPTAGPSTQATPLLRPTNNTPPEASSTHSLLQRSKTAEYYNEDTFANKKNLAKYQCIHCKKIPTSFFRCQCGKVDGKKEVGKGRARFEGNTGLSCSDCTHQACTDCGKSNQYEPDTITNGNIRKLKKGGEHISLENESHITQIDLTTPRVAPGHPTAPIPQQGVLNSSAPVLTTTRVAPGHPPALIPQQGVLNSNAPVLTTPRAPPAPILQLGVFYSSAPVLTTARVAPGHPMAPIPQLGVLNSNAPVLTTARVAPGHPMAPITQLGVLNSNAPVLTTARVAPGHPMAPITQLGVLNSNAPVIPQLLLSSTNPANPTNPTAGPNTQATQGTANNTLTVNRKVSSSLAVF